MALNQQRLENKINGVIEQCRLDEGNAESSKQKFSSLLAKAIIEEIKELKINYNSGLTVPSSGGAVVGIINATIE